MTTNDLLAKRFEQDRAHLRSVAYRMLGSASDADDAVQEAWLRLSRSDTSAVENLTGWLTTVVARVSLDMLRSRKSRREDADISPTKSLVEQAANIEQEKMLADHVGLAVLVVLDTLDPAERLAFVLHDLFGVSFGEIAEIIGRSPAAARQLASRARRRVQGAEVDEAELARQRPVVDAFLTALKTADFDALLQVLDPDVLVRTQGQPEIRGATKWAKGAVAFAKSVPMDKIGESVRPAIVNGNMGVAFAPHGNLVRVIEFVIEAGLIHEVEVHMDPAALEVEILPA
ncbi:MAG TPA: sigma-70 family RNA polymerase sigma factor [Kofleriaceae bacterium]|nr:sigma-70 family RNA polymerase sigma factor [Kofleriaceae bacterium]